MNQMQIKHVRLRVEQKVSVKTSEIRAKYKVEPLQPKDIHSGILDGTIKLRETLQNIRNFYGYGDIVNYFEVPERTVDYEAMNAELEKLQKFKEELLDQLIVGDSEVALKLLKELDNYPTN